MLTVVTATAAVRFGSADNGTTTSLIGIILEIGAAGIDFPNLACVGRRRWVNIGGGISTPNAIGTIAGTIHHSGILAVGKRSQRTNQRCTAFVIKGAVVSRSNAPGRETEEEDCDEGQNPPIYVSRGIQSCLILKLIYQCFKL